MTKKTQLNKDHILPGSGTFQCTEPGAVEWWLHLEAVPEAQAAAAPNICLDFRVQATRWVQGEAVLGERKSLMPEKPTQLSIEVPLLPLSFHLY